VPPEGPHSTGCRSTARALLLEAVREEERALDGADVRRLAGEQVVHAGERQGAVEEGARPARREVAPGRVDEIGVCREPVRLLAGPGLERRQRRVRRSLPPGEPGSRLLLPGPVEDRAVADLVARDQMPPPGGVQATPAEIAASAPSTTAPGAVPRKTIGCPAVPERGTVTLSR
jgi:hypothetical protein